MPAEPVQAAAAAAAAVMVVGPASLARSHLTHHQEQEQEQEQEQVQVQEWERERREIPLSQRIHGLHAAEYMRRTWWTASPLPLKASSHTPLLRR